MPGGRRCISHYSRRNINFHQQCFEQVQIAFYPRQDGAFGSTYASEGGAGVRIHGNIRGDLIEADITNPPCQHHWHLTKVTQGEVKVGYYLKAWR